MARLKVRATPAPGRPTQRGGRARGAGRAGSSQLYLQRHGGHQRDAAARARRPARSRAGRRVGGGDSAGRAAARATPRPPPRPRPPRGRGGEACAPPTPLGLLHARAGTWARTPERSVSPPVLRAGSVTPARLVRRGRRSASGRPRRVAPRAAPRTPPSLPPPPPAPPPPPSSSPPPPLPPPAALQSHACCSRAPRARGGGGGSVLPWRAGAPVPFSLPPRAPRRRAPRTSRLAPSRAASLASHPARAHAMRRAPPRWGQAAAQAAHGEERRGGTRRRGRGQEGKAASPPGNDAA